jgi:hypothetical protein
MMHEISQLDIPDRQLLPTNAQRGVNMWTDIGEARITHTIFGKAKVRIIRKHDLLLTALMVMATAAAAVAWQTWSTSQQTELPQGADPASSLSATAQPADQAASLPPLPAISPAQTEVSIPANSQKSAQQVPDSKSPEQMAEKALKAQPLLASKPQTAPLATGNNTSKNQTDMQQASGSGSPKQLAAPAIATPSAAQPAANRPEAVAPLVKEETSTQVSAGDPQPAAPVNVQSK